MNNLMNQILVRKNILDLTNKCKNGNDDKEELIKEMNDLIETFPKNAKTTDHLASLSVDFLMEALDSLTEEELQMFLKEVVNLYPDEVQATEDET